MWNQGLPKQNKVIITWKKAKIQEIKVHGDSKRINIKMQVSHWLSIQRSIIMGYSSCRKSRICSWRCLLVVHNSMSLVLHVAHKCNPDNHVTIKESLGRNGKTKRTISVHFTRIGRVYRIDTVSITVTISVGHAVIGNKSIVLIGGWMSYSV